MFEHDAGQVAAAVVASSEGRSIAAAESCTAGRIATALASVDHAVETFRGGVVAYQEGVKRSQLGVTAASVLCERAAREMAVGAAELFGTDATVATTGVVGDDPVEGVEPGTVFIATYVDGVCRSTTISADGKPPERCDRATSAALCLLREHLAESARHAVDRVASRRAG